MKMRKALSLVLLLVLALTLIPSADARPLQQSVSLSITSIEKTEAGFVVRGTVTASRLNPEGQIVESDDMEIYADIKEGPNSIYQKLPESMYIRAPAGAETPYTPGSGPGGTMTEEEAKGTNIILHRIAAFGMRNNVWREYGGLGEWEKNAPSSVTKDFEGTIPLEHAGKTMRIRATLTHRWGGPYANWPAFSYHHATAETELYSGPEDSDGDGVADLIDECPNTPPDTIVDDNGCPAKYDCDDNYVCDHDRGENCAICPKECPCDPGEICYPSDPNADPWGCVLPIKPPECHSDSDCDDGNSCTTDTCNNPGTSSASCSHTQITSCIDNDGCCPGGCNVNTDNDCETPVKKTQLEILKEIHEITKKSIEEAKKKAKALKDSPTPSQKLEEELKRIDKGIEEIESGIKDLEKYTEDVKQKVLIEELKAENKRLKIELGVTKLIKDMYLNMPGKSVIETPMEEGTIKTKENEVVSIPLRDDYEEGKPAEILLILDENSELTVVHKDQRSWWFYLTEGFSFFEKTPAYDQTIVIDLRDMAEVTSDHTKFETSYDPTSKIATVTVFEDYVTVRSLKTNDPEMIVSAGQRIEITDEGFSPKLELTQDDLLSIADRYAVAFGGRNPLSIGGANRPPTASFSIMPENPEVGDYIVVASTSSDPDGDMLTYSWYVDGVGRFGDSPNWEWENPEPGEYEIRLVVDDGRGGSDEHLMEMNVRKGLPPQQLLPIPLLFFGVAGVAGLAAFALLLFLLVTRRKPAPAAPPVTQPARPVRPRGRPEELVSRRPPARPEGPPERLGGGKPSGPPETLD